jgi:hypothetical protein
MSKIKKVVKKNYPAEILNRLDKIVNLLSPAKEAPMVGEKSNAGVFIDCGDGTIKETKTGLMWQKEGSSDEMNHSKAKEYCKNSDVAGYKDWRLPTVEELISIVDYKKYDPAINGIFKCKSSWYWTETIFADGSDDAWIVDFYNGCVDWDDRGSDYCVRPVRQY